MVAKHPIRFTVADVLTDGETQPVPGSVPVWTVEGPVWAVALPVDNQTGTSYTLTLLDANDLVTLSNANPITVTVPSNAAVPFPINTQIQLLQLGAGQVTVAITSDTLNGTPGLKLRTQYSMATLVKITATAWVLAGDLSA